MRFKFLISPWENPESVCVCGGGGGGRGGAWKSQVPKGILRNTGTDPTSTPPLSNRNQEGPIISREVLRVL